eukprot:COSAG06_NODE_1923_length_8061_cov_15.756091_3_plen_247_part_00
MLCCVFLCVLFCFGSVLDLFWVFGCQRGCVDRVVIEHVLFDDGDGDDDDDNDDDDDDGDDDDDDDDDDAVLALCVTQDEIATLEKLRHPNVVLFLGAVTQPPYATVHQPTPYTLPASALNPCLVLSFLGLACSLPLSEPTGLLLTECAADGMCVARGSVCLSDCLTVCLSACLPVCLSARRSVCLQGAVPGDGVCRPGQSLRRAARGGRRRAQGCRAGAGHRHRHGARRLPGTPRRQAPCFTARFV